ncbi:hypothetical protein ACO2Q8_23355 [Larkinella sp. VNQ87]|uniref:hypothetical protein n=1 Tax=Larkinella sp. VNQ87 TaxID=3400921 RepID=UPI003C0D07FA
MVLTLTTIDNQQQWRNFFCQVDELETAFDILSGIVQRGSQPVRASLRDGNGIIDLPLDIFNNHPFSEPIRILKKEWESILAQPLHKPVVQELTPSEWFTRLLKAKQNRIENLQKTLGQMQNLLLSTKKEMAKGPYKTRLMQRYQSSIDRYADLLAQAQLSYTALLCPATSD